jgi:hypothetical protein
MDPLTILAILKALSGCVLWAFDAIDKVKQAEAAEIDALKKLKTSISIVENDISIFKKLISALQSSENERLYSAFVQRYATSPRFASGTILSHVLFQARCQRRNE